MYRLLYLRWQIILSSKVLYISPDVYSVCYISTFCNPTVPDQVITCSKFMPLSDAGSDWHISAVNNPSDAVWHTFYLSFQLKKTSSFKRWPSQSLLHRLCPSLKNWPRSLNRPLMVIIKEPNNLIKGLISGSTFFSVDVFLPPRGSVLFYERNISSSFWKQPH